MTLIPGSFYYNEGDNSCSSYIIQRYRFKEGTKVGNADENSNFFKDHLLSDSFTLVDSAMGALGLLKTRSAVATAEINIDYLRDLEEQKDYILFVNCEKFDGRNLYPTGTLYDTNGNTVQKYTSRWATVAWNILPL
jgi:hypothetical protein